MRRAALICALVVASCARERTFIQLPSDVEYVALIEVDANNVLVHASALERYDADAPPNYAVDLEKTHFFIGWSAAQLEAIREKIDSSARLEAAPGCRTRLPEPLYYAKIDGDKLTAAEPRTAPLLGAPWLDGACPDAALPTDAVLACEGDSKRATLIADARCRYRLQVPGDNALSVAFDVDGLGCVATREGTARCEDPRTWENGHELICEAPVPELGDGCALVFYRTPEPLYEIETLQLSLSGTPHLPANLAERGDLSRSGSKTGYATDILPMGPNILVAVDKQTDRPRDCFWVDIQGEFELVTYDRNTLEVKARATAPPCLSTMTPDLLGSGFIATYRVGSALMIGRFELDGTMVQSASVAADAAPFGVWDSAVFPERNELVLLLDVHPDRAIVALDLLTFAEKSRAISSLELFAFDRYDDHRLVFAADPAASRCILDLDQPELIDCQEEGCLPTQWIGFGRTLFDFYVDPKTRQEIVSASVAAESVWVCDDESRSMGYYDRLTQPAILSRHPLDEDLILVSGISIGERGELSAVLDVLDLDRRRFLPGTQVLDGMYIGRIRLDEDQHIWLLHPWNSLLTRLTPRGRE